MPFCTRNREEESELERVLHGTLFSSSRIQYDGKDDSASPVYIVPVDTYKGLSFGTVKIGNKLIELAIGHTFSNCSYRHHLSGQLIEENFEDRSTFYFPLKHTGLLKMNEGSLFPVLGIEGSNGLHPLVLASKTEEGMAYTGFCNNRGKLKAYCFKLPKEMDRQLEDMLSISRAAKGSALEWENPRAIIEYLDEYVIGQNEAKKVVAVAFSSYMTKARAKDEELLKPNMLLIGSTGVGKTYMISLLAKKADLPMVQVKLTSKTSEGFKGENISSIFEGIRSKAKGEAPYGIVFLDEIDKMAKYDIEHGFGQLIQDEMIGWLEEAEVMDSAASKYGSVSRSVLNTRNLLFVTAGAFSGSGSDSLADIVKKRVGAGKRKIGFGAKRQEEGAENILLKARPEDIIAYGLKPELVGRLPCIGVLDSLTKDDKIKILKSQKSSPIENYARLLRLKGYEAKIDSDVLDYIADRCPEETGARGLKSVCIDLFNDILLDIDNYANNKVVHVTRELAEKLITLYN